MPYLQPSCAPFLISNTHTTILRPSLILSGTTRVIWHQKSIVDIIRDKTTVDSFFCSNNNLEMGVILLCIFFYSCKLNKISAIMFGVPVIAYKLNVMK